MNIMFDGERVRAGTEARERFYDSRGYGRPRGGDLELAPVEAAHLLFRGDIEHVPDHQGRALDFGGFLTSTAVSEVSFLVYKELRDRGFYLSPARPADTDGEFAVYPRGQGPWDDEVAYRVRAVSERESVPAGELRALVGRAAADGATGVLAVVDEESEVTYLELTEPAVEGETDHDLPRVAGRLLSDRVLVSDPPTALYERAFYGQQVDPEGLVQLSLVEAASLADRDLLALEDVGDPGAALRERGRAVEGDRFDRRLRTYSTLRGTVSSRKRGSSSAPTSGHTPMSNLSTSWVTRSCWSG